MTEQRTSIAHWWTTLDDNAQARMLDLAADDAVPEDLVPGLTESGIVGVSEGDETKSRTHPRGFAQPRELRAFLAEQHDR
jgi:hypothetical protein